MTTPNLPAHLQQYEARDIGQMLSHNLGTTAPPYVSIAGNRFNLIDAAGNEMAVPTFDPQIGVYLDACIIDSNDHLSRIYYAQKYDPSAATFNPPDCWSDNGTGPSVNCSSPQAKSCTPDPEGVTGCKWAVWGSAVSNQGKGVPACQQVQKVALLIPGIPQTIFLLRVPPNSHKHLRAYVELCKGSGVIMSNVITRIYFDQTTQGTLLFKGVDYIDAATAALRQAAWNEKKTDGLVGRTDIARPAGVIAYQPTGKEQPTIQFSGQAAQPIPLPAQGQIVQVQQPGPFPAPGATQQTMMPTSRQDTPMFPNPSGISTIPNTAAPGGTAPAASPSEPTSTGRRRRRTQAEMHPPTQAVPAGQAPQAAPQAPFPHPGQQQTTATPPSSFGMAPGQPATANPELAGVLDSFFGKQG